MVQGPHCTGRIERKILARENREFGSFAKTQGILSAQVINILILKIKDIFIFAEFFSNHCFGTVCVGQVNFAYETVSCETLHMIHS